jgi:hypothetical protein
VPFCEPDSNADQPANVLYQHVKPHHMTPANERDPYWKLRPEPATPEDEICRCSDRPPIVLQDHLSSNPIACLKCNGEVPPESIGISAKLANGLAYWRDLDRALHTLWLDSGGYEAWARIQLEDPVGEHNVRGLELVQDLNTYRRTYYWWFQDASVDDFVPVLKCPRCSTELVSCFTHLVCEGCSIVVPNR